MNAHLLGWFGSGTQFFHIWTNTNNSTIVLVNLAAWNKIPSDKRTQLQEMADRFEVKSTQEFVKIGQKTMTTFAQKGGTIIQLHGAALKNLEALAATVPWQDMRNAGMPAEQVGALRKAFNPSR